MSEDLQRYRDVLNGIKFDEGNTDNIYDYYIGIKCEDISLAIQQPIPDSLNEEIITYTRQGHHGKIKDEDLYNLLCAARYFDFFFVTKKSVTSSLGKAFQRKTFFPSPKVAKPCPPGTIFSIFISIILT